MRNLMHTKRTRLKAKRGFMKHLRRWKIYTSIAIIVGVFAYIVVLGTMQFAKQLFNITAHAPTVARAEVVEEKITPRDIDLYTGEAIDEFFDDPVLQSEMRMIMHCLLRYESWHGHSKGHGDGGKAGGPLQFWQDTWVGYRKIMIEQGFAEEIGSRYDLKEAARTTVWAIKDGRAKAWGPIYRTMNGRTDNTCPVPSWY